MSGSEADVAAEPVGVVLAGGQSRRMGHDKTSLSLPWLEGMSLLEWAVRRISDICEEWVVADAGRGRWSDERSVPDGAGKGPAAGILGAADRFPGRDLIVLACDLPLIPREFLLRLQQHDDDWVVPVTEQGPEPLCARYGRAAIRHLRGRVEEGRYSLRDLSDSELQVRSLDLRDLIEPARRSAYLADEIDPGLLFANLNRPQDLEALQSLRVDSAAMRHSSFLRLGSTRG